MKTLFLTFLLGLTLLNGCDALSKAKDETVEAMDNLKTEAVDIKEGVEEKIDQVNEAKEDVGEAVDAVNEAAGSLKAITE